MCTIVLSSGTSVPDSLSSIVVARKGEGDMAIASAIANVLGFQRCGPTPPPKAVGSSAPEFFTVIRPARDRVGRGRRRHRRRAAVFNSMTIVGLTGIFAGHLDQQRLA